MWSAIALFFIFSLGTISQQFRNFFVTIALTTMLAVTLGFNLGEMGTTSSLKLPNQQGIQIAGAEAFAKDVEGKTQEAMGNMTGNRQDQVMGRAKQAQSDVMEAAEDAEDQAQELQERSQAAAKEAADKVTENRTDQYGRKIKAN